MNWEVKKDDSPLCYELFYNSLNKDERKHLDKLIQKLSELTQKGDKGFFGFKFEKHYVYVESCVEEPKNTTRVNHRPSNFIIQYITPVFNFIIEGILRTETNTILISFHDCANIVNLQGLEIVEFEYNTHFINKHKPIKKGNKFLTFDRQFLIDNEINPMHPTKEELDYLLLTLDK